MPEFYLWRKIDNGNNTFLSPLSWWINHYSSNTTHLLKILRQHKFTCTLNQCLSTTLKAKQKGAPILDFPINHVQNQSIMNRSFNSLSNVAGKATEMEGSNRCERRFACHITQNIKNIPIPQTTHTIWLEATA